MPDRTSTRSPASDFFDTLSAKSKLKLYTAIFFTFAAFGPLWDIGTSVSRPWYVIGLWILFSGLTAVAYAYAFTGNLKFLFIIVPLSGIIPTALERYARSGVFPTDPTGGQPWHLVGSVALVVIGYILFIRFIQSEGARNLRIRTEVSLAEGIHDNLVPPIDQQTETLQLRGICDSSSEVGGDLLDAVIDGDRVRLCVADVSGHGVQAGLMMAMIKSALRMRMMKNDELNELVDDLNHVAMQVKPPGMFTTAAFLKFDGSRTAHVTLAGHPPIIHYRATLNTIEYIDSEFPPLGILETDYRLTTVDFDSGDLFVILTDGLIEVFNAADEDFGQERIAEIVKQHIDRPLPEIESAILNAVRQFGRQDDDQTLLLVRAR